MSGVGGNESSAPPFHERFTFRLPLDEMRERFSNRCSNQVNEFFAHLSPSIDNWSIVWRMANALGKSFRTSEWWSYISPGFYGLLEGLEALYVAVEHQFLRADLERRIRLTLSQSELDLGIKWQDGRFWPKGAELLDDRLVSDPLDWLEGPELKPIREPLVESLQHLLAAHSDAARYKSAVISAYEAVEAMAKTATGKDKELGANRDRLLKVMQVSKGYQPMVRGIIDYANDYRHAASLNEERPMPKEHEVEGFIYLCGLLIRLTLQALQLAPQERNTPQPEEDPGQAPAE